MAYYNKSRTHLSLNKDPPVPRPVSARQLVASPPFLKSADYTIGTNASKLENRHDRSREDDTGI